MLKININACRDDVVQYYRLFGSFRQGYYIVMYNICTYTFLYSTAYTLHIINLKISTFSFQMYRTGIVVVVYGGYT